MSGEVFFTLFCSGVLLIALLPLISRLGRTETHVINGKEKKDDGQKS